MKEFLRDTVLRLPIIAGINQHEKLSEQKFIDLVRSLDSICQRYGNIGDKDKERLIIKGIETDPDFYGLNQKILVKWFSRYIESNRTELTAQSYEDLTEIEERNRSIYERDLLEKRKLDPDYDPVKHALEVFERLAEKHHTKRGVGVGSRLKREINREHD